MSSPKSVTTDHDAQQLLDDTLAGLSAQPKRLNSKYFYDETGCQLFDEICELDEYYVTRTELELLAERADEMAREIGEQALVIELGAGSATKTHLLLEALLQPSAYISVDIANDHLEEATNSIDSAFGKLEVHSVSADFTTSFEVPEPDTPYRSRLIYFPGSTIGNFATPDARKLLANACKLAGEGGFLLIGLDLEKDLTILEAAYNDAKGVTAQFNLNLLARLNRELGANFRTDQFQHLAQYNPAQHRIEMHLVSQTAQDVEIDNRTFHFREGESICTEYSHKYNLKSFEQLLKDCGFTIQKTWTDSQDWFAIVLARVSTPLPSDA